MKLRTFFVLFATWVGVVAAATYVGTLEEARAQWGGLVPIFPFWLEPALRSIVSGGMIGLIGGVAVIKGKEER